ncbi:uncharacterized protein LOC124121083 [Haliotis rufescens]|uniref:uncharacterized protein LOC124121083 n=1 Tax=Haliotis rufescens TaxID=6454 RepID=UPI00201F7DA6|nr:uncharacterized protein LOC124121083 [Haliotis rufescens]
MRRGKRHHKMNPGSHSWPSLVLVCLCMCWLVDETRTQDWFLTYPGFFSDFGAYATQAPAPPWGNQYDIPQNIGALDLQNQAGTMNAQVQQGLMDYQQAELMNPPRRSGASNDHQTQTEMRNAPSLPGAFDRQTHAEIRNGPDQPGVILQPEIMSAQSDTGIVDSQNQGSVARQQGSSVQQSQTVLDPTSNHVSDVNSQVVTGPQTGKLEAQSAYPSQWQGELRSNRRASINGSSRAEVGSPAPSVPDQGSMIFSGNPASSIPIQEGSYTPDQTPRTVPVQGTRELLQGKPQPSVTDHNAWHQRGGTASVGNVQSVAFPQQSWQPNFQDQQAIKRQYMHTDQNMNSNQPDFIHQSDPRTFQTMLANQQNQQSQQNSSMSQSEPIQQHRVMPSQHVIPWGMIRPSAYSQLQAMDPTTRANWIYQMQMKTRQYYRHQQKYPTQTWNVPAEYATITPGVAEFSTGTNWLSSTSSTTKQYVQPHTPQQKQERQLQSVNSSSTFPPERSHVKVSGLNMAPTPPTSTQGQQTTTSVSIATRAGVTSTSSINATSEGNYSALSTITPHTNMTAADLHKIVRILLIPQLTRVTTQAPTMTLSIPISRVASGQVQRPISEMFIRMINFAPRPLWISAPMNNNRSHKQTQPLSEIHVKLVNYDQRIVDSFNGHISSPHTRPSRREQAFQSSKRGHKIPRITLVKSSADIPNSSVHMLKPSNTSNDTSAPQSNVQNHQHAVVRHTQMLHHVMNNLQKELNRFQGTVRHNRDSPATDRPLKEVKPSRADVGDGTTMSVPQIRRQLGHKPPMPLKKDMKPESTIVGDLKRVMPVKQNGSESTSAHSPLVTSTPSTTTSSEAATSHMTTVVQPSLTKPDTATRSIANSSDFKLKDIPAAVITGDPRVKRNKLSELLKKRKSSFAVPLSELPNVELTAIYSVNNMGVDAIDGQIINIHETGQKTLSTRVETTSIAPSPTPTTTLNDNTSPSTPATKSTPETAEMRKQQINDQLNEQLSVLNRLHQRQQIIDHQHQLREQQTRLQKQRDILQQQLQALQKLRGTHMGIGKDPLSLPDAPGGIASAWHGIQLGLLEAGFK